CPGRTCRIESLPFSSLVLGLGRGYSEGFSPVSHACSCERAVEEGRKCSAYVARLRFVRAGAITRSLCQSGSCLARRTEVRRKRLDNCSRLCRDTVWDLSNRKRATRYLPPFIR